MAIPHSAYILSKLKSCNYKFGQINIAQEVKQETFPIPLASLTCTWIGAEFTNTSKLVKINYICIMWLRVELSQAQWVGNTCNSVVQTKTYYVQSVSLVVRGRDILSTCHLNFHRINGATRSCIPNATIPHWHWLKRLELDGGSS